MITKRLPKKKLIAIIAPNQSALLKEICFGILSTLEKYEDPFGFRYHFIFGNDNIEQIAQEIQRYPLASYDLIFTLGAWCTQIVKDITTKNRCYVPIVFGGIVDPVAKGIIQSTTFSGNHLTGVTSIIRNYDHQANHMLMLKPGIKRVLFLTGSADIPINKELTKSIASLEKRGIVSQRVEISHSLELERKIVPHLPTTDLIITTRGNILSSNIKRIIPLCNEYHIPLYTSDLSSVELGAAAGYGDFDHYLGRQMAYKALPILIENKIPHSVPISPMIWSGRLMINRQAAELQGLPLNFENYQLASDLIVI